MRHRFVALLVALLGTAVLGTTVAFAAPATATGISGYEISAGAQCGTQTEPRTCGTTFVGWTDTSPNAWQPVTETTGGAWLASLNYAGTPGVGGSGVTITGGVWSLLPPKGPSLSGSVMGGSVLWPNSITFDAYSCGAGVARFTAALLTTKGAKAAIAGCLDDTHLSTVFPPHIWGTFSLN
jgi:hypothetical protein